MTVQLPSEEWADKRAAARQELPPELETDEGLPAVLLTYQAQLLSTTAVYQFVVCEKSRRIGMTWAVAADAVLTSGAGSAGAAEDA